MLKYNLDVYLIMKFASIFDQICTSHEENKQHLTLLCNKLNILFQSIVLNVIRMKLLCTTLFSVVTPGVSRK